jgi:hypothetical protein
MKTNGSGACGPDLIGNLMNLRDEVQALIAMGPLPSEEDVVANPHLDDRVQQFQDAIESIVAPVTREEAVALLGAFGPDSCFGLAWAVLHLIESTPGGIPIEKQPAETENEWIRRLWARSHR